MAQTAPVTLASGTKVVFSVWLKMASGSVVGFPLYIIGNSSGVIGSSFPTVTTTWQRFSVSGTMGGSDTTAAIQIGVGGPGPISTSFYVWGPQLETGTVETQYIPTAAYSVISTRPALYPASSNGSWRRGAVTSEAAFNLRSHEMSLTAIFDPDLGTFYFPGTTIPIMQCIVPGLFDSALVQVFTAYWSPFSPANAQIQTNGVEIKFTGQISDVQQSGRSKVEFTVTDMLFLANLKTPPKLIQASCRHTLFDVNCTLSPTGFTNNATVATGSTTQTILTTASLGTGVTNYQTGDFTQGYIVFTSGQNNGLKFYIKSQLSDTEIFLANQVPFPLAIGDTFTAVVGCNKTIARCTRFNNLINIGATPFVPNPEIAV